MVMRDEIRDAMVLAVPMILVMATLAIIFVAAVLLSLRDKPLPLRFFRRVNVAQGMLTRWIVFSCPLFGLYVHRFNRSDYASALHDHPWPFIAVVIKGGYWEHHDQTADGKAVRVFQSPGSVLFRPAAWRHRIELKTDRWYQPTSPFYTQPSWSIVFIGPRQRPWGFWLPTGWCWWRRHNQNLNICEDEIIHHGGGD